MNEKIYAIATKRDGNKGRYISCGEENTGPFDPVGFPQATFFESREEAEQVLGAAEGDQGLTGTLEVLEVYARKQGDGSPFGSKSNDYESRTEVKPKSNASEPKNQPAPADLPGKQHDDEVTRKKLEETLKRGLSEKEFEIIEIHLRSPDISGEELAKELGITREATARQRKSRALRKAWDVLKDDFDQDGYIKLLFDTMRVPAGTPFFDTYDEFTPENLDDIKKRFKGPHPYLYFIQLIGYEEELGELDDRPPLHMGFSESDGGLVKIDGNYHFGRNTGYRLGKQNPGMLYGESLIPYKNLKICTIAIPQVNTPETLQKYWERLMNVTNIGGEWKDSGEGFIRSDDDSLSDFDF